MMCVFFCQITRTTELRMFFFFAYFQETKSLLLNCKTVFFFFFFGIWTISKVFIEFVTLLLLFYYSGFFGHRHVGS